MQNASKEKIINSYTTAWLEASFSMKKEEKVFVEVELLSDSMVKEGSLWQKIISQELDVTQQLDVLVTLSKKLKLSDVTTNALKIITENLR